MTEVETEKKPKKTPKAMIFREIAQTMNGAVTVHHPFPKKFVCLVRDFKRIPYVKTEDDVLRITTLQEIADSIQQFCQTDASVYSNDHYAFLPKDALECAKLWLSTAEPIDEQFIKMVRFKDEPGYCYRRLPWTFEPEGDCPTF